MSWGDNACYFPTKLENSSSLHYFDISLDKWLWVSWPYSFHVDEQKDWHVLGEHKDPFLLCGKSLRLHVIL